MNKVLLTGNLTKDFKVISEKLASCSVAVSKEFGSGVEFIDIVAFNSMVENVKDLKKGTTVFVEGSYSTTKNNDKKYVQIVIGKIEVLKAQASKQEECLQDLPQDDNGGDDDLPF